MNTAMEEIMAIQHQFFIATLGRAGVRKGGTKKCIVDTLAETKQWPVTEEHFGVFFKTAEAIKAETVAKIEALLVQP